MPSIKQPNRSEVKKLIEAYALRLFSAQGNAPYKTQVRFYDKFEKIRENLQKKYPDVDINSGRFLDHIKPAAKKWWDKQVPKGPGKHW